MKRVIAVLALVVAVIIAVVALRQVSNRRGEPGRASTTTENRASAEPEARVTVIDRSSSGRNTADLRPDVTTDTLVGPAPPPQPRKRLILSATLAPAPGAPLNPDDFQARFGIGSIASEDVRERQQAVAMAGDEETSIPRVEDLANIRMWRPVTISGLEDGSLRLGPENVLRAPTYRILAWDADRNYYWHEVTTPADESTTEVDAGTLSPAQPTGLRLHLKGEFDDYPALIERVPGDNSEEASKLLTVVQHVAPEISEAILDEAELFLTTQDVNKLYPLVPDHAVRIVLISPTGEQSKPVEYQLTEGQVLDVELDAESVFPPGTFDTLTLRGKLLLGESDLPVAGAEITVHDEETPEAVTADDGSFEVELPMAHPTILGVNVEPPDDGRPVAKQRSGIEFSPERETTGAVVEQTYRIPAYMWFNVDVERGAATDVKARAQAPYPVYLLQSWDTARKAWRDDASDHFDVRPNVVGASVDRAGRYRVIAAASPVALWSSEAKELTSKSPEATATLERQTARELLIRVLDQATKAPLVDVPVTVQGPHSSLPPMEGVTNASGEWSIPVAGEGTAMIEARARGYEPSDKIVNLKEKQATLELVRQQDSRADE